MSQPRSIAMGPLQALGDVYQVVWRHAWRMMILRHQGEWLDSVKARTRVALVAVASLTITLCTLFAPADDRLRAAFVSLFIYLMLTLLVSRASGGGLRVTGLAILVVATEPLGLALRWIPGLEALDHVLSLWFVVACAVLFLRTHTSGQSRNR